LAGRAFEDAIAKHVEFLTQQFHLAESGGKERISKLIVVGALRMMLNPDEAQIEKSSSSFFYSYDVRNNKHDLDSHEFDELSKWRKRFGQIRSELDVDWNWYFVDLCKPLILRVGSKSNLYLASGTNNKFRITTICQNTCAHPFLSGIYSKAPKTPKTQR
jgi:hypothetical protein